MFTPEHIGISLVANAIGLCCVLLLNSASPRLVLSIAVTSMAAIILPWEYLGSYIESVPSFAGLQITELSTHAVSDSAFYHLAEQSSSINFKWIWWAVGVFWVAVAIVRSYLIRADWFKNTSEDRSLIRYAHPKFNRLMHRVRIRRVPDSAMVVTTGLWKTNIWIGEHVRTDAQISAALNHELCHVAASDQFTLYLVVIIERLLWWNPLIWMLGQHARRNMEYACDSRCRTLLGPQEYRQSLAELFLVNQSPTSVLEIPFGAGSDVVNRMEKLDMKPKIKFRHLATLASAGILLVAIAANAATKSTSEARTTLVDCHELVPENVHYDFRITSNIDTREGKRGEMSVTFLDAEKPDSKEWPADAMEFMECVRIVLGVGEDEGWPGTG